MLPLDTKMRWWKTPRLILYSAIICGTEGVLMQCRWANCFLCFVLDDQKGKYSKTIINFYHERWSLVLTSFYASLLHSDVNILS